ncbi:hypothetical protein LSCM1_03548 [Leishmania martiniquensis]|uniref:Intraflagellar transport protein 43 n=1 Tax=Leishmania martiniquensis TaxID=1580590 RepID=A0A836KIG3_9TRYP|nr:hypothetical protein LSCM1_03548 [Leishmania martiniquensis]
MQPTMASTGDRGGKGADVSLPSPLQTENMQPLSSAPNMIGLNTSLSRLDSMRAITPTVSGQNSPTEPSKRGSAIESPFFFEADRKAAAESSAPPPLESGGTDRSARTNARGGNGTSATDDSDSLPRSRTVHGRCGRRREASNWFDAEKPTNMNRPADTELSQNVRVVQDDVSDMEQLRREQAERAQRQKEQLAQPISDSPVGYHVALPRLNELDVTNSWDKLLRAMRNEYDMSCLTSCLSRELDEDVAWNPEMLLVQLTSDMLDAAELQKDGGEVYVPVDASDIGQMTGGEVTRKRKEKGSATAAPTTSSPTTAGAARELAKTSEKAAAAQPPPSLQKTTSMAVHMQATNAPAAAAPSSRNVSERVPTGATLRATSPPSRTRTATDSRPGEGGGGGGNSTSVSSSKPRLESTGKHASTRGAAARQLATKPLSKR